MDIGREVRRYRAEPVISPVPGRAPAPAEQAVEREVTQETAGRETAGWESTVREMAVEAT